jgi:hypothetical protein
VINGRKPFSENMPNISFAQAATTLGVTGLQLNPQMCNPACPAPTANPCTGIAAITFDHAAITSFAATMASAAARGWKVARRQ